jgi:secreted protein with Ig-like and vWFA domain
MNHDDPKLTAYALDELDPAERVEIEQLLRDDPTALQEMEETMAFAAQLRCELEAVTAAPLEEAQRANVLEALAAPSRGVPVSRSRVTRWLQWSLPLAASILVVGTVSVLLLHSVSRKEAAPSVAQTAPISADVSSLLEGEQILTPLIPDGPDSAAPPSREPAPVTAEASPDRENAPKLRGDVEQVKQYFVEAEGFYQSRRYDLALKRAEQILNLDPWNIAARNLQDKVNKAIDSSGMVAYNEARNRTVRNVDRAWSNPIRRFTLAASTPPPASPSAGPITEGVTFSGQISANTTSAPSAMALSVAPAPAAMVFSAGGDAAPSDGQVSAAGTAAGWSSTPVGPAGQRLRRVLAVDDLGTGNAESYARITDNTFLAVQANPLSTFSIDVDTASYANVRRMLNQQTRPPRDAVRIEEMLNYFSYDYPQPKGDDSFSATMEVAACPWDPEHRLVRIGLKGREIEAEKRPACNLVFLIDVSGSMSSPDKLPLLKQSLALLVDRLLPEDTVSIAVYAGASGTVLPPTRDKDEIRAALDRLHSGGSTNGGAGIQLAYRLAEDSFIKGGVNRVILATDGDFNVGVTSQDELTSLIERKAKSGVFLTVLGFGMGNLKDSTLEKLADKGNGNYAYIDSLTEGRKVLVEQINGTLVTIAKDVKIQVEFNPAQASAYRLIGYENRLLAKEDFNDDKKDAGEIGAGHTVTALYEVVPIGAGVRGTPAVDPLKYQPTAEETPANGKANEWARFADPGDAFINAYMAVQSSEIAEQTGKPGEALSRQQNAAAGFAYIARQWPDWQPSIVDYRQKRVAETIARLQAKVESVKTAAPAAPAPPAKPASPELLTLKLRYKQPDGDKSKLLEFPLTDRGETWEKSSPDFRFAASVASFGMLLRESPHKGASTWETVRELALEGRGEDRSGYRAEFLTLIDKAKAVTR